MNTFSIKQAMSAGLKRMESRATLVVIVALLFGGIGYAVQDFLPFPGTSGGPEWSLELPSLINITMQCVWMLVLTYTMTVVALAIYNNTSVSSLSDWKLHLLPKFAVGLVLFYVGLGVGLILIILPGIIFAVSFGMFIYVLIEKGGSIFDSYRESARLTKGYWVKLVGFNLLLVLVMYGCLFLFGVLFGLWSWVMPFGLNDVLLKSSSQIVAVVLMVWMLVAYIDVYKQLEAIKGHASTSV